MKELRKPGVRIVVMLPICLLLAFIVIVYFVGQAHERYLPRNMAQRPDDSFYLKKSPIGGPIMLLLGDSLIARPEVNEVDKWISQRSELPNNTRDLRRATTRAKKPAANVRLYTVILPFGMKCRFRLQDGTEVVMQVGSSLRFPSSFGTETRLVELNGCAYFNVARGDKRPFLVRTKRMIANVTNSRAAVLDYLDGSSSAIMMESGLVRLQSPKGPIPISAGHSVEITADGPVCRKFDIKQMLFWKEPYFDFDGLDIRQGLVKIAMAYRMHVVFEGNLPSGPFGSGKIQTDLPLARLLKDLELPNMQFEVRMSDSTIVVKGGKG